MEPTEKYLSDYRLFFENFSCTTDNTDQIFGKQSTNFINESEIAGNVVYWAIQYLNQKQCPASLLPLLANTVLQKVQQTCEKQPAECGFKATSNVYESLKLIQFVTTVTNGICQEYQDNTLLSSLPAPNSNNNKLPKYACTSVKNIRRKMEDRYTALVDLNTIFGVQTINSDPISFFGVFDGHAGHEAAAYAAVHLPQYLVESKSYDKNISAALKEAFLKTDDKFVEKSKAEGIRGGTTAVIALWKPGSLTVAWVGDSQALLVKEGRIMQIVTPHKPEREDERKRIEDLGGFIVQYGIPRVNGQLAISRAIGDAFHKPYVMAEPDIKTIQLDGHEDFLILASDGLWDFLAEDHIATFIYDTISNDEGSPDIGTKITQGLVSLAKQHGSMDNVTVILVFLKGEKFLEIQQFSSKSESVDDTKKLIENETFNVNNLSLETSVDRTEEVTNNPVYIESLK